MKRYFETMLLIVLAIAGVVLWCRLALPRYQSIDLSIDQRQAGSIAQRYLQKERGVDIERYRQAIAFVVDENTDRYLQKTLGAGRAEDLMRQVHYDLFSWSVRFFKENQKEEFNVVVGSKTGAVIGFNHSIEETAARPLKDKEESRQQALAFLRKTFAFNPAQWTVHAENVKKYDHRLEYSFSWQNKAVDIPWDNAAGKGSAKLLTRVTVCGNEILAFNKYQFNIPEGFNRYVDRLKQTGQNLSLVFRLLYLALLTMSLVVVVNRKNHVVMSVVKRWYIGLGVGLFLLMVLDLFNGYENILFDYPTSQSFVDYSVRQLIEGLIGPFFIVLAFVLSALAGESLRFEVSPTIKNRSFLNVIVSTLFSSKTALRILIGYFAAAIILGMQACIFNLGFKYCGVWDELSWLTQASTTWIPAVTALTIAMQASFSEESMFRLFAINLFKKYRLPSLVAVVISAVLWGFGHTGYEIFPMWFRGVEVTCIGIVMGFFYLRFGLITVICAHFVIDAFLSSLPYLLHPRGVFNFDTAMLVIGLPFILAVLGLIFNKSTQERPLNVRFNPQQEFNYGLLEEFCRLKTPDERKVLKESLERYGWDAAIVQRVFEQ